MSEAVVFEATAGDGGRVWVMSDGEWGHEGGTLNWALDALAQEVARLKPSGQVAADVETLEGAIEAADVPTRVNMAPERAALSSLAAKAQGYDAAIKDLADEKSLHEATHDELHKCEAERDAAVADNAALIDAVNEALNHVHCHSVDMSGNHRYSFTHGHGPKVAMLQCVSSQRHPGAALLNELETLRGIQAQAQVDAKFIHEALGWEGEWPSSLPAPSRAVVTLLETHRKKVAQARNGGLEEAAAMFDCTKCIGKCSANATADKIRALKKETP